MGQQLVLMGAFFVISVYLSVVLALDAFQIGKHLLPLSVAIFVSRCWASGSLPGARRAPRAARALRSRERAPR